MRSKGYAMILAAAKEASKAFEAHRLKSYLISTHKHIGNTQHVATRRMWVAQQAGDIETIMGDLK